MAKTFLRTEFNYDMDEVSRETGLRCLDPSKTVQADAAETDINVIMERVVRTGVHRPPIQPPMQGDFSQGFDLKDALDLVRDANRAFMEMPAKVRSRFGNDPVAFADFCSDSSNIDEMRKMGLAVPETIPDPAPVILKPE